MPWLSINTLKTLISETCVPVLVKLGIVNQVKVVQPWISEELRCKIILATEVIGFFVFVALEYLENGFICQFISMICRHVGLKKLPERNTEEDQMNAIEKRETKKFLNLLRFEGNVENEEDSEGSEGSEESDESEQSVDSWKSKEAGELEPSHESENKHPVINSLEAQFQEQREKALQDLQQRMMHDFYEHIFL